MTGKFVSYLRVSNERQGRSGLGLEAQRAAVTEYLNGGDWTLIREFIEVESGKRSDRPQLAAALHLCRLTGATLVVAKLDRLARDAAYLRSIERGAGEGGVVFCDLPNVPAGPVGKFLVSQMANVAELEAGLISARTKAALAAAKERGKKLGGYRGVRPPPADVAVAARRKAASAFAASVGPIAGELRDGGLSLRQIAAELTCRGIRTSRGGQWTAAAVNAVLQRAGTSK